MESIHQHHEVYIPRRKEAAIREQIDLVRDDGTSRVVLLYGARGVGKTKLVRALANKYDSADGGTICVEPIDVDDSEYWPLSSLERAVATKLGQDPRYFGPYLDYVTRPPLYPEYPVERDAAVRDFGRAKQKFIECYRSFVSGTGSVVVITLDTVEAARGRTYLLLALTQWMKTLPRTLFILSGRPSNMRDQKDPIREQLEDPHQSLKCMEIRLRGFDPQEALSFLDSSALQPSLQASEKEQLVALTEGYPLWLTLSVDFLEHNDPPQEMVEPTVGGARLREEFRRRLITPYRSTDFWPEAIKRLAVVRHSVDQQVWQRLMDDCELPEDVDSWEQAWELLLQRPWVRPRANRRYVTLHDGLAEELAQRIIPLHDQDGTWRLGLWGKAASIYDTLTIGIDQRLSHERENLKTLRSSKERDDLELRRRYVKLDTEKRELDQFKTALLHYRLLDNFQVGSDSFIELYEQASASDDLLLQELICHELERFLPHGETTEPLEDLLGIMVERFHRWLGTDPIRYLEIGLRIAHFFTQNEQPRAALKLLDELPESSTDPDLRYRLANERGNACMRIPGQIDKGEEYFRRALEETSSFDSSNKVRREAEAHKELGFYYRNLGRWQEANEAYDRACYVISQILGPGCSAEDREEMASIQTNWAYLKARQGNYQEARNLVDGAIAIRDKLGLLHSKGVSLSVSGEAYRYEQQFVRAWKEYEKAEEIFHELESWPWLGVVYQEQAICLYHANRESIPIIDDPLDRARYLIRQALEICRELAIRFYPSALNRAGRIFGVNDVDLGLRYLDESIGEARRIADGWFLSANLIEYLELSYRAWAGTEKQCYRDRIDDRIGDVKQAMKDYDFPHLRCRWALLQGHLMAHDALSGDRFDKFDNAVEHYSRGFVTLADERIGSHRLASVSREFQEFRKIFDRLPRDVQLAWYSRLRSDWSDPGSGRRSTSLLARLEELY